MKHPLEMLTPYPLKIVWHENRTTYLTVKKEKGQIFLRIHRLFYDAPTPVLEALISYALGKDKRARATLRQMAHLYFSKNRAVPKKLDSNGKVYNLQEIFDRMGQLLSVNGVSIGWSSRQSKGKFRSITFGTFDPHTRQIRINRILDQADVPLYFLEYIVYHEMLHALIPSQMDGLGRCSFHTKEFREKERQFPFFEEAKKWEKISLSFFRKRGSCGRP